MQVNHQKLVPVYKRKSRIILIKLETAGITQNTQRHFIFIGAPTLE